MTAQTPSLVVKILNAETECYQSNQYACSDFCTRWQNAKGDGPLGWPSEATCVACEQLPFGRVAPIQLEQTCNTMPSFNYRTTQTNRMVGLEGIQEMQHKIWTLYLVDTLMNVINYNTVGSTWKSRNTFPRWGWLCAGTGCSGRWWSLHPQR